MGAGASTSSTPAVIAACTKLFQEQRLQYEALIASNASPATVVEFIAAQGKAMSDCAEKAAKVTTSQPSTKAVHQPAQRGLPKGGMKRGQSRAPRASNRRRSYGNSDMKKFSGVAGNTTEPGASMMESASAPSLDAVEAAAAAALSAASDQLEQMKIMNAQTLSPEKAGDNNTGQDVTDHWDSVRDLPFCDDCQMAFKTMSALTRHVKYSNLHETTIAKKKADAEATEKKPELLEKQKQFLARQEEGKDYRLLYFGSKFFWRTQDNIDLSFYQHIMLHTIEIIPFDVHKNKEMGRIYLDKFAVDTLLEDEVKKSVAKKKQNLHDEAAKSKFTVNIDFNDDAEFHAAQRIVCTSYILARLNLTEVLEGKKHSHKLLFHTLASDDQTVDPELKEFPDTLVPVSVTHRRNSSAEEVKAKLDEVSVSQDALRASIGKAEKVSGMVHSFIKMTSQSKFLSTLHPAKKRFIMAARKVMQINGVEKTKKHLEILAAKASLGLSPTSRRKMARVGSQKHREA
jgi:hypothetical protein